MFRISDVVKHLLVINILLYFGSQLMGSPYPEDMYALINEQASEFGLWGRYRLAMFFPTSEYFRPYQLVTHMFMHGSVGHLFFNMFALFMFGPPLEMSWGPRRFLFFYLFTGFGALTLHMLVQYIELSSGSVSPFTENIPVLGASGAVFGILAGYGMLFPNSVIQLLIPPIPLKAKYFVLIYAGLELFFGLSAFAGNSGVAHFAHVGGALFGFLLIVYWRKFGARF